MHMRTAYTRLGLHENDRVYAFPWILDNWTEININATVVQI